jgi:hydrogenase maturation protease
MTAPLLVFGWGNLSRGDDAAGPLFVQQLSALYGSALAGQVDFLEDYQLQIEHALDLVGREQVLFVDASLNATAPFEATTLHPARGANFTTHAMSPESVMQVYRELRCAEPPPCTLLAIRGMSYELGALPCEALLGHLASALSWGESWIARSLDRVSLA